MNGLILLSIGLIALVGALCTMIYVAVNRVMESVHYQQQNLDRFEARLNEQLILQERIHKRLDQLATDVLQREIYQTADDRHQLAIADAKQGRTLTELMRHHGLSSDEAALILSLHTPETPSVARVAEASNANLKKPAIIGSI